MAKGLSIYIGAETKDAIRGLGDIEGGLEQVQNELGETVKDSAELERKFSDDVRDMAAASGRASRDIANDFKTATDHGRAGFKDFRQEAVQNVSEVSSSFSGDLTQAIDGVQGTLGGLAASLSGPAAVAAAGAAIGVGFITEGLVQAQEQADELKERLTSAYKSAVEEGRNYLDEVQIIAAATEISLDPAKREEYQKRAESLGVSASEYIRAMAGDEKALNELLKLGVQLRDEQKAKTEGMVGAQGQAISDYDTQLLLLSRAVDQLQTQKDITTEIAQGVALAQQIRGQDYETMQKQNKALADMPKTVTTKALLDTSDIDEKLSGSRTLRLNIEGYIRDGARVI